jgi:multidrug efflux system membrane fusion protein
VQAFVYKVSSNHTASMQNIVEQTTDGNMSAVQGLNPGDTVSITGFDKLQDGAKVEIEESDGSAAGTLAGKSAAGQTR